MGATSTKGESTDFERPESGVYAARCIQVVELGTHEKEDFIKKTLKRAPELLIVWEISEKMQDGKPFIVTWRGTNSLYEKANLYKILTDWRGRSFTEAELNCFALGNLLDKVCLLNIVTEPAKNGKTYTNVKTVTPLPKGMEVPDRINELVDFGIQDLGTKIFDQLYPWVQKYIAEKSDEGKVFYKNKPLPEKAKSADEGVSTVPDDDIPF